MVVEYIRYRIPEQQASDFLDAYKRASHALRRSPHCLGFEMTRCRENPSSHILRIEWDSLDGHLQGFRQSADFREFLVHVRPFIDLIEEMQHYDVLPLDVADSTG